MLVPCSSRRSSRRADSVTHRRAGNEDRCSVLTRLTPWPFAMKTPSQWTGGRNVDICRVPSAGRTKTGAGGTRRQESAGSRYGAAVAYDAMTAARTAFRPAGQAKLLRLQCEGTPPGPTLFHLSTDRARTLTFGIDAIAKD